MTTQATDGSVLQQFVERASSCYSLPAVAMEVLELTGQENVDLTALRECVERDPALTAKLLRVVNSSMFGLSREVTDLKQALALLGVKPLKLLVLGFSLPKELYADVEADTLERFWKFTLVKAVAARELSKSFWETPGDEAFTAGLLQEIGVLVLVKELGSPYINFLLSVHEHRANLLEMETATLGFDHAILSARLLDHWRLPNQIVRAVATPLELEYIQQLDPPADTLPEALHIATLLASILVHDRRDLMPQLVETAGQYRDISVEQIDDLLDQLQAQVHLMADMFSVPFQQEQAFHDLMWQAHQQMSQAVVDALPEMIGGSHPASLESKQQVLHNELASYAEAFLELTDKSEREKPREAVKPTEPAVTSSSDHVSGHAVSRSSQVSQDLSPPDFEERVRTTISVCRARRQELSLILLEIENHENLLLIHGGQHMSRVGACIKQAFQSLADTPCECVSVSDARVAVVLPGCERQQAVNLARSFNRAVPTWLCEKYKIDTVLAFSTGISALSLPTRSSQPQDLIDAADRCLFAAKRAGGNVVKSIDVL